MRASAPSDDSPCFLHPVRTILFFLDVRKTMLILVQSYCEPEIRSLRQFSNSKLNEIATQLLTRWLHWGVFTASKRKRGKSRSHCKLINTMTFLYIKSKDYKKLGVILVNCISFWDIHNFFHVSMCLPCALLRCDAIILQAFHDHVWREPFAWARPSSWSRYKRLVKY